MEFQENSKGSLQHPGVRSMRPVRCPRPIKLDSFALELDIGPSNGMENPTETLTKIPPAFAVVDSKSLYAVPSCSEYRTLLEALVIKDRLREGIEFKGVHGAAQMADALTKDMQTCATSHRTDPTWNVPSISSNLAYLSLNFALMLHAWMHGAAPLSVVL